MKAMYVACNPKGAADLTVEREITELQRQFLRATGEPVDFIGFPGLPIEELPLEIGKHQPDILHISAHGDREELALANTDGRPVKITGPMLASFVDIDRPPSLVYLNACNSEAIARAVVQVAPMAIGTTAPISNRTARASALLFYDRLLNGSTVQKAFEAARSTLEALQDVKASSMLHCRKGIDANKERLHQIPRIIAHFTDDRYKPDSDGDFDIELGVAGCPANTSQVVFFTDDESFIDDDSDDDL